MYLIVCLHYLSPVILNFIASIQISKKYTAKLLFLKKGLNMVKLRVSDLAKQRGVSVQTIYKQIKKGVLTVVKEEGVLYVLTDNEEVKHDVKQSSNSDCKELLKIVKTLNKEIKSLGKQLAKCNESKEGVFIQYIQELKQLQLPPPEEVIIKPKKDKRKNKKKYKNKKK